MTTPNKPPDTTSQSGPGAATPAAAPALTAPGTPPPPPEPTKPYRFKAGTRWTGPVNPDGTVNLTEAQAKAWKDRIEPEKKD